MRPASGDRLHGRRKGDAGCGVLLPKHIDFRCGHASNERHRVWQSGSRLPVQNAKFCSYLEMASANSLMEVATEQGHAFTLMGKSILPKDLVAAVAKTLVPTL